MNEVYGWWSATQRSFRASLKMERTLSDPWAIARSAVAIIAASAVGWALDDPLAWAMMTVGAFICGIGTLLAPIRHRAVNALVIGVGFSLATFVGVWLHPMGWWFLVVLAVASYVAGLWRAFGAAPGIRACLVTIGLMITADLSPGTDPGLTMVMWMAAGSGMVFVTQLLPPYGRRQPAQRKAVAALYQALATYAATAPEVGSKLPSAPFTAARRTLDLLPAFARPAAAPLFGLLAEAENIRRSLFATADDGRLPRQAVADRLAAVATTVASGRPRELDAETRERLGSWSQEAKGAAGTLVARLAEADRLAGRWWDARGPEGLDEVLHAFPVPHAVRAGLRRLRAETRPGAPLSRHAVRIALGTTAGEAAGRALGAFWGHALPHHGFWAALTTMLVLFPDYGHTFARGWARPIGSILGGLAAWAVLLHGGWSPGAVVVASAVLAVGVFVTLRVGQLVLNFFITAWIVFLITRLGSAPHLIAYGRPADTVLGALIGLAVFLIVPTYHHHRVHVLLAEWLRVQARILPVLVTGYASVGAVDPGGMDELRGRSREARERLEAAAGSLRHEPRAHRSRWSATELDHVTQSVDRLTRRASLVHHQLPRGREDAVPEAAEFAEILATHLEGLATAVATGGPVRAGELRAEFDASAARSGLADLVDVSSPDHVSHARGRALTLLLGLVVSVEELVTDLGGGVPGVGASSGAGRPSPIGGSARTGAHGRHAAL
ncbi:FUSC family protein [Streptomyces tsukubensis]|uniref:Integral membrane bound transporter domain-containing protein n=1 Tax=Streptomyces tsukubensis TaxID=83656 RepID=A0A1V4AAG3_9ACTN|nr:FUSC family protein [Streptomyces tsukubensis]OON80057.1 hypothetical protein B1H18_12830 [Streptomyces tsukubensis]